MGAKFGRVHRAHLDTRTVGEAISYLCSQFPEARKYLINSKDDGVGFAVFRGQKNLSQDELSQPVGDDEIRIAPVLIGSKNGGVF
jgi:predicted phage tail protein